MEKKSNYILCDLFRVDVKTTLHKDRSKSHVFEPLKKVKTTNFIQWQIDEFNSTSHLSGRRLYPVTEKKVVESSEEDTDATDAPSVPKGNKKSAPRKKWSPPAEG